MMARCCSPRPPTTPAPATPTNGSPPIGDPRAANVDPVLWVELIPFQETRHYVQRVLGNYLVYRARLGQQPINPVAALHSIAD